MANGRLRLAAVVAVAAVALAACNNSSTTSGGGGGGAVGGSPPASGGGVGTTKVSGVGTVLDASNGFTLYHLTSETNGKFVCTGSCESIWPPFVAPGGKAPTTTANLPGKIGTITRPDGTVQVTYDGFPLYTYSGDSGPGQASGNGIQGVWFAVTPKGDASGASGSSGRYGNGGSGSGSGGSGGSGGGSGGYGYGGS